MRLLNHIKVDCVHHAREAHRWSCCFLHRILTFTFSSHARLMCSCCWWWWCWFIHNDIHTHIQIGGITLEKRETIFQIRNIPSNLRSRYYVSIRSWFFAVLWFLMFLTCCTPTKRYAEFVTFTSIMCSSQIAWTTKCLLMKVKTRGQQGAEIPSDVCVVGSLITWAATKNNCDPFFTRITLNTLET